MRLTPVFLAFSAFLAFGLITPYACAQVGEVSRLKFKVSDGSEKTEPLRPKADKGEAKAQFDLGFLHLYGDFYSHLNADQDLGMFWIRKSAAQGYAQAQDLMGCLLHRGGILAQDKAEAVKWFRKAADQGDAYAQSNLGYCYYKGEGVAKDSVEAVRWFRLAAAAGEVKAQRHLGLILEAGEGVPKDYSEAAKWFFNLALLKEEAETFYPEVDHPDRPRLSGTSTVPPASSWQKAASDGDVRAQYELGRCYEKSDGVAYSLSEALKWYRRSAQGGYAPAQFILGYLHDGRHQLDYDHEQVISWYGKAAAQGYAKAQYNLGYYYGHGEDKLGRSFPGGPTVWSKIGVPKNPVEALKWYRLAAENGHSNAQYVMGKFYYSGEVVTKDHVEAFKWWRKAAESGHPRSTFNVGVMCFLGHGADKDYAEATRWFQARAMHVRTGIYYCQHGMPHPRPMVDGNQAPLAPLKGIPKVR
jgi:TPR repeat protein